MFGVCTPQRERPETVGELLGTESRKFPVSARAVKELTTRTILYPHPSFDIFRRAGAKWNRRTRIAPAQDWRRKKFEFLRANCRTSTILYILARITVPTQVWTGRYCLRQDLYYHFPNFSFLFPPSSLRVQKTLANPLIQTNHNFVALFFFNLTYVFL